MSNIPVQIDQAIKERPQPFTEDDMLFPEGIVKEIFKTGIELKM